MRIEELTPSPADQSRAVAALTLAFVRDPVMRFFYPEPDAYLSHFPALAKAFGAAAFDSGTAWMSSDHGATALWLPSGVAIDAEAVGSQLLTTIHESKHEALGSVYGRAAAYHPDEPHWYLSMIGVDAAHQGQGLGARLLEVGLEHCDREGALAYLESSNPANLSFYERHGFEILAEIGGDDTPSLFPMLRSARSRG
jgi:ribosomal protein S18 acetylase RimI-like enzyme